MSSDKTTQEHSICIGLYSLKQLAQLEPVTLHMEDGTVINLIAASDFPAEAINNVE